MVTSSPEDPLPDAAAGGDTMSESPSGLLVPGEARATSDDYVLPIVHARLPRELVHVGFVTAAVGAVAAGVIELPAAILVGLGIVIARHGRREP